MLIVTPEEARPSLSPEEVAGRQFAAARKGYDRGEVRAFLEAVASELAAASERMTELERLAARSVVEAEEAEPPNAEDLLEAVSAEAWRDEVLADLDRRRRELNGEVVRLRAGRDRLRADLDEVADELAEQLRRLDGSLQAARSAGDLAEQRSATGSPRSVEERRAELEAARLAGFATVSADDSHSRDDEPGPAAALSVGDLVADPGGAAVEPAGDVVETLEVGELFARLRAERTGAEPGDDQPSAGA